MDPLHCMYMLCMTAVHKESKQCRATEQEEMSMCCWDSAFPFRIIDGVLKDWDNKKHGSYKPSIMCCYCLIKISLLTFRLFPYYTLMLLWLLPVPTLRGCCFNNLF